MSDGYGIGAIREPAAVAAPGMGGLRRLPKIVDGGLEVACVLLLLGAALVACYQVFLRYVLQDAQPWPEELARWAFCWSVFLGMAMATGREAHIAVDLFSRSLWPRAASVHRFFVRSVMAGASAVLVVHGLDYVARVIQVSPGLQWPMRYLFLAVPVGGALNLFFLAWPRAGETALRSFASVTTGVLLYLAVRFGAASFYGESGSATVLMAIALILVLLDVPIAFAMIFGTFAAFAPLRDVMLVTVSQNMAASLNSFTLLAIPFFILAAAVMNAGGITPRLVDLAMQLVGHLRGGLGQANVVTNTMLAGISGSSTADASTVAKLMVPEMEARGYDRPFSCALTAASATIANLIPPGLALIIYAALASTSVGALFVATILPGLLVAATLMVVVYIVSRIRGFGGDMPRASGRQRMASLGLAVPALILPLVIVGGVRFGAFTATEAGAIAFLYAVLCGAFLYRKLTGRNFVEAVREAAVDTVVIAIIIAAAAPFAWVLAFEQVPQRIAATLESLIGNPVVLLLAINLFLLVVGLFMEMIAALVILVPILVPIIVAAGIDPVHFGIVMVLNLVIGALTPPFGVLVFTTARVGQANVVSTFRAILPFLAALLLVLAVVTFVPQVTMLPVSWFGP